MHRSHEQNYDILQIIEIIDIHRIVKRIFGLLLYAVSVYTISFSLTK